MTQPTSQLESAESELSSRNEAFVKLEADLKTSSDALEQAEASLQSERDALKQLQQERDDAVKTLAGRQATMDDLQSNHDRVASELTSAQEKVRILSTWLVFLH